MPEVAWTVRADTWATARTVAAQIQGPPNKPQPRLIREMMTMSRWRPAPFSSLVFSLRNQQFLGEDVTREEINHDHDDDTYGNTEVTQSSSGVLSKELTVPEDSEEVGNEEGSEHQDS